MGEGGEADFGPFEADVGKLPGVTHARVVSERGRITEIHVVADGLKDPRALKRDIETLASAKYHLELDHRIISISTLPDVITITATRFGFELVSLSVTTASGIATCTVVVRRGDETAEGTSTGGATTSGIPKIVARAVVDAVSRLLGYTLPADVENAFFTPVDDLRIATVVIRFVEEDGSETPVPGTQPVRADQNEAIARAALVAVNRHFGM